jgi:hypothetical protein
MSNIPTGHTGHSYGPASTPPPVPINLPDTSGHLPGGNGRYVPPLEPIQLNYNRFCGDKLIENLRTANSNRSLKDRARRWDGGTIVGVIFLCIIFLPAGVAVLIIHHLRVKKRKHERLIHCDGCMEYLNDNIDREWRGYLRLDFHSDRPCKQTYLRRELIDIIQGTPQLVSAPFQTYTTCDGCNLIIRNNYYQVIKSNVWINYCTLKCHEVHHRIIMERVLHGNFNVPSEGSMDPPPLNSNQHDQK